MKNFPIGHCEKCGHDMGDMGIHNSICSTCTDAERDERIKVAAPALLEACKAGIKYDEMLVYYTNLPTSFESHHAEVLERARELHELYCAWITATKKALREAGE